MEGEKATHQVPLGGPETMNEMAVLDSETSSATKTEHEASTEGLENVAPKKSRHPQFGGEQVFSNNNNIDDDDDLPEAERTGTHDKVELTEDMCYDELGFSFPTWKKWYVVWSAES